MNHCDKSTHQQIYLQVMKQNIFQIFQQLENIAINKYIAISNVGYMQL